MKRLVDYHSNPLPQRIVVNQPIRSKNFVFLLSSFFHSLKSLSLFHDKIKTWTSLKIVWDDSARKSRTSMTNFKATSINMQLSSTEAICMRTSGSTPFSRLWTPCSGWAIGISTAHSSQWIEKTFNLCPHRILTPQIMAGDAHWGALKWSSLRYSSALSLLLTRTGSQENLSWQGVDQVQVQRDQPTHRGRKTRVVLLSHSIESPPSPET